MNSLYCLFIITIFSASCTHQTILNRVEIRKNDSFYQESLYRYSADNLSLIAKTNSNLGLTFCHQGNTNKGLKTLRANFFKNEENSDYWHKVGNCFYLAKDYVKARYFYLQALSKTGSKKSKAYTYNNLALTYIHFDHYQEASLYLQIAKKNFHKSKVIRYNQAIIAMKFGLYTKSNQIVIDLLKESPNDTDLITSAAITFVYLKQNKKALDLFNQLPNDSLKRPHIANYHALNLIKLNKIEEAHKVLRQRKKTTILAIKKVTAHLLKRIETIRLKQRGHQNES